MTDEAIQKDVSALSFDSEKTIERGAQQEGGDNQDEGKAPSAPKSHVADARTARLNELAATMRQTIEVKHDIDDDQDDVPGNYRTRPESDEPAKPQQQRRTALSDDLKALGFYLSDAGDIVTKMKINGQEVEVPASQVKVHMQKDLAGDVKLQQAADASRRLAERERLIAMREQQQRSLTPRPPKLGAEEAKAKAAAIVDSIYEGTPDQAVEALAEVLQRGDATVDPNEVSTQVRSALQEERAREKQQEWERSKSEGNAHLKRHHGEIYSDPRLFSLVNSETERMVNDPEYADLPPKDIIIKAAEFVQQWMNGNRPAPSGKEAPSSAKDRKAGLTRLPRGQDMRAERRPPQEKDLSGAAVLARMRAARPGASR